MVELADEQRLITASQNGDPAAFETLVRTHQHMIHAVAYRMTGNWNDAEDLAQDTFIQAFRHLAQFRGEARFSSWLCRIAVNQCLNWKTRSQSRERLHEAWHQLAVPSTGEVQDLSGPVQEALLKLKPKQRAAIILTTYEGLNHAEAATTLGCSETTVSWYLFTARSKLKALLRDLRSGGEQ